MNDDYITPKFVWENIKQYIPDKLIWESFYCNGKSGEDLKNLGFKVIHKNIDFFTENEGEIIISNPPYSKKKEILTRLKFLDKPFIMLMPCSTIATKYFQTLFANSIQIIVPKKRIHFKKLNDENKKSSCDFDCFYFCYKMNLPSNLIFL